MNEICFMKYYSKYQNENKIGNISTLPLFRSLKLLHSMMTNYVLCIWKRCLELNFELPSIEDYRWNQNANIYCIEEPFTKYIKEISISNKYNENEVNEEQGESDNKDDKSIGINGEFNSMENLQNVKRKLIYITKHCVYLFLINNVCNKRM